MISQLFHLILLWFTVDYLKMNFDREENDTRRAELVRLLEHSIERLTLAELEALYYDLVAKDYIRQ